MPLDDKNSSRPKMGYAGAGDYTDESLILRLNDQAAHRMSLRSRLRNRFRSTLNSRRCVVEIDDGLRTRQLIFDQPPTIGQLSGHVSRDEWIVSVKMRRVAVLPRLTKVKAVSAN